MQEIYIKVNTFGSSEQRNYIDKPNRDSLYNEIFCSIAINGDKSSSISR